MNKKSIVSKVDFLLSIAKSGICKTNDLYEISSMINEHSEHAVLGRVFGYSVSDYAFATLKWLNTKDSLELFNSFYEKLKNSPSGESRQKEINELIESKMYLDY